MAIFTFGPNAVDWATRIDPVIEAQTYRQFGRSRTDPGKYRPAEEVERWLKHDPLDVTRARLEALGVTPDEIADYLANEIPKVRYLAGGQVTVPVLRSVERTSRLGHVEENPYQGGWGGTVVSIVAEEGFDSLDAPIKRVASACVPLPFADTLENQVIPSVDKVVTAVEGIVGY